MPTGRVPQMERFSRVVEDIYAAALEPRLWPEAVRGIAELHDSPKCNLLTPATAPADGGFIFPHGIPESFVEQWGAKYVAHDVWYQGAVRKGLVQEGKVVLGTDVVSERELEASRFHREFVSKQDMWHICAGFVFDGRDPAIPNTACSVFRGRHEAPFDSESVKLHELVIRHLSRALGTMFRLRDQELRIAASLAALDRLSAGVLLFGDQGEVLHANRGARASLALADGLRLRPPGHGKRFEGWLAASKPDQDAILRREILDAVSLDPLDPDHFSRGVLIARPSGKRSFLLQVSPLALENEFSRSGHQAFAIGFLTDFDAVTCLDRELLRDVYGFTGAEARLAQELLSGDPIDAIAARLGVGESTVRTQLRSLFEKTRTKRQAQLVKLLMGLSSTRRQ